MIRSALSSIHFCARRRTLPRPSKPIAAHSGCAARARVAIASSSAGPNTGIVVISSPVAGFSTGIVAAAEPPLVSTVIRCSTLDIRPLLWPLSANRQAYRTGLASRPVSGRRAGIDRLDLRRIDRPVLRAGRQRLDRVDRVHPVGDAAEHGVLALEARRP